MLGCWGRAQLCQLTPDPHPSGPTSAAGSCAGRQFPNPFCHGTGSCQSSLSPWPRLPLSNCVYTPRGVCSACHLQRWCPGLGKTPQIQPTSPVPPPTSALAQSVLFEHSSQISCRLQIQLLAESNFLRLHIKIMEKAIFCLCEIFKHPKAERKDCMLQRLTI